MTTTYSVNNNLTHVRGRHSIKTGFEVRVVNSKRFQTGLPTHFYDNVADLIADRPNRIQVIFGSEKPLETTNYAAYIQDDIRFGNKLTVNAGLRWDLFVPWVEVDDRQSNFDESTGRGTLYSVNSYKYRNDRKTMYGPQLGNGAQLAYNEANGGGSGNLLVTAP